MKKRQELPFTIYPSCPPFFLWSIWKRVDGIRSWPGGKEEKVSKQAQQGVCGGVPRCSRVWRGTLQPTSFCRRLRNRTHRYCQGLEQRRLLGQGRFHAVSSNWAPTVYSGCPRKRVRGLQNKRKSVGAVTQSLQRSTHSSILT